MAKRTKRAASATKTPSKTAKKIAKKTVSKATVARRPVLKTVTNNPSFGTAQFLLGRPGDKTMETMMTQGKSQMDKAAQDAANFGRESTEALMKFSQLFTKGFEDIMREAASLAQTSAEKQAQYIKQAMSTKTLNEWAEVQSKMAQANFDDFMEGATKISELSVKVFTESVEPFNAQMSEVMKKTSSGLAAA